MKNKLRMGVTLLLLFTVIPGNVASVSVQRSSTGEPHWVNRYEDSYLPVDTLNYPANWSFQVPEGDLTVDGKGIALKTGIGQSAHIDCPFDPPINLTSYHFMLSVYLNDSSTLSMIKVLFESSGGGWSDYYATDMHPRSLDSRYALRTGWNNLTIVKTYCNAELGEPEWHGISNIRIIVVPQPGASTVVTINGFKAYQDIYGGQVILRFDDNRLDTLTEAKPIMDKHSYPGVAAICTDWVKNPTRTQLNLEQIAKLYEAGWDIVSHGLNHIDFTELTQQELANQCYKSRKWLLEHGFKRGADFVALPFDSYNREVLQVVKRYYNSTCGTLYGYNAIPVTDPYNMHRMAIPVSNTWSWETVKEWIDETTHDNLLTIIAIHDIDPETFETLVDYLYNNNVNVVTFSQLKNISSDDLTEINLLPIFKNEDASHSKWVKPKGNQQNLQIFLNRIYYIK